MNLRGVLAINIAADGVARTEDFLHGTFELLCHGLRSHGAGNRDDLVKREIAVVDNILGLLSITGGLLELSHDKSRSSGDYGGSGLVKISMEKKDTAAKNSPHG